LGVDPEAALRASNAKFELRFKGMEQLTMADGKSFEELNYNEMIELYQRVKKM
jgi:ATP diphosphatase